MTRTAGWISGDKTGAYRYLSASVETFKTREQMKADIESAGFGDVEVHPLTLGVAVIYVGFVK
jgi:ubiquinone/menaquinone biosynthesis C-methylase UbiE